MRTFAILLLLLLLPLGAFGATLSGTAYTQNFAVAQYTILTINTTPEQRVILEDGTYNLTVPPGTYVLRASLRQSGHVYEDEVVVRAVDEREYAYDLILFRTDAVIEDEEDPTAGLEFPEDEIADSSRVREYLLGGSLLLLLLAGIGYFGPRTWWKREAKAVKSSVPAGLPSDLSEALAALKAEGGRATQKDLRKRLPYSEAKVSMMLADLEARGLVKRIKQGRANLIVLK